jgi:hypothetical protein
MMMGIRGIGMINTKILILGVLFLLVMAVPVSAELKYQKTDDGKELISNGSYWMKWDPVGDHVVGDKFLVNVTTNFPVGTELGVGYGLKNFANVRVPGTGGNCTVESGSYFSDYNISSILINTAGLRPGEYLLTSEIISSPDPSILHFFNWWYVYDNLELYQENTTPTTVSPSVTTISRTTPSTPATPNVTDTVHEKNTTVSSVSSTPKTPLPAVTAIAALLGFGLFLFARKNEICNQGDDNDE